MKIPETGVYTSRQLRVSASVSNEVMISREPFMVTLDAEKVPFPLTVRRIAEGDRFTPYGMKGSRLVSDFLTDKKVPLIEKRRQLVVTDGTGKIIWLVGHRTAQPVSITTETKKTLRITMDTYPSTP
jgi:tRNA(Ile)-lysidine synthase